MRHQLVNFMSTALAAALACAAVSFPGATAPAQSRPLSPRDVRAIALVDQDGRPFRLQQTLGKVVVLNFVFTGCGSVCPVQTADLAAVQARLPAALRDAVAFVSVSIDPEHDVPQALKAFALRNHADLSDWTFLTGDPSAIGEVERFFHAIPRQVTSDRVAGHATTIQLFDRGGRGLQRYTGDPLDQRRLATEIQVAASIVNPAE